MVSESLEEYVLVSAEAAYEDPWEQALTGFIASGGEYHEARNFSHWLDQKCPSFNIQTYLENTIWETVAVHMSVSKEAIRKATGRVNAPLEWWGCTNPPYIPYIQVTHLQELPQQDGLGNSGACEVVTSRVQPTKFSNGREQGFPGYPVWKRSNILKHNKFHVHIAQGLPTPIV